MKWVRNKNISSLKKQKLLQVCGGFLHFQPAIQKLSPFIIMWWVLFPLNGLLSHKHRQATGSDVLTSFKIRYPVSWKSFLFRLTCFFSQCSTDSDPSFSTLDKTLKKRVNQFYTISCSSDSCLVYVKCLLFAILFSLCKFVHTASWNWFLIPFINVQLLAQYFNSIFNFFK